MVASAFGIMPGFEDKYYRGQRPQSFYIPRFRNLAGETEDHGFLRGYGYQGLVQRMGWQRGAFMPGIGTKLKEELRRPGPWMASIGGMGECLPFKDNRVTLDKRLTDKWGIPQVNIQFTWQENEKRMASDMGEQAGEMLRVAGFTNVKIGSNIGPGGIAVHEMGTARMGHDPATSVLNKHNQCHDVPNLYVTDGSAMTSSACQNPSLTYMALTARAANHAADSIQSGVI